jgi:hypothetical protein
MDVGEPRRTHIVEPAEAVPGVTPVAPAPVEPSPHVPAEPAPAT